jgi:hypothetical protein
MYFLSALVLLGGLFGVMVQRGLQNGALLPWAWLMVGLIGLVFVLLQLRATLLLGSLALRTSEDGSVAEAGALGEASKKTNE